MTAFKSATISACCTYRYRLERRWDGGLPVVAFIMLNPSTANDVADDPTIRRCVGFARSWGFGGLIVGNLFALRSTSPKLLYGHADPVGPHNDEHLLSIAREARKIVCAWGTHGSLQNRDRTVTDLLDVFDLSALKTTAEGHPAHPLYIAADTCAKPYEGKSP